MGHSKIIYIHANNNEIGGADYCLFKMAREVRNAGFDPIVILCQRTSIVDLYQKENIPVRIVPLTRIRKSKNPLHLLAYLYQIPLNIYRLYKVIREEDAALVHTNDLMDLAGNFAARLAGIPSCHHIRMIIERPVWLRWILSFLSKAVSTQVICVSHGVKGMMYSSRSRNVTVVYDWLDMDIVGHKANTSRSLHAELGLESHVQLVGCVGRLEPWKGQHVFLRASEIVASQQPNVHFVLVGGPTTNKESYVQTLQKIRQESTSRERITFLGHRIDISSIMQQLDVMVHSSVAPDPLPGVVMEAMYNRTLVVGANTGGVPEQIVDGENGYLYGPGDSEDMAAKILLALKNSSRSLMNREAKEYVTKKFNKETLVKQLVKLYGEILHS